MDRERWARIESIGARAAEMSAANREVYLTEACNGDDDLRRQIESLLEQVDSGDSFLDTPLVGPHRETEVEAGPPVQVGEFRVVGAVGEGGMGTVYEAERTGEGFVQRVALKLVRSRLMSGAPMERFMRERRILAVLDHPGIARFVDGGSTAEGHPYVAMEFVEGRPLTDYCRESGLTLEDRLALFDQVCEAVQHAHENLIVHRDLKPSNILVTESGQPKLLDFGISKLLAEDTSDATRTGHHVLTPRYAAPEQLTGAPITTATDVYALGIILYQLLTGLHPYAPPEMELLALHRATLSEEVDRPSVRMGRREAEAGEAGNTTGASAHWRRRVAGDLDSIVLKALRKESERRYPTVAAFRDDLGRWREGRPVSAQPDSTAYRVRKFVARHRVPLGVVSAAFVLVSASAVFSGLQFRRAERQALEARQQRDRAEGVASFLTGLFEWADPNRSRGAEVTARELLAAGSARVDSAFSGNPDLQASLYGTMAPIYTRIGLHEEAEAAARKALAAAPTPGDPETLARHTMDLARALHGQARYDEAELAFGDAVESLAAEGQGQTYARALGLLGGFYAERGMELERAEELLGESLAAYGDVGAGRAPDATVPMQALAIVYRRTERPDEALALYRDALDIVQDSLGRQHTRAAAILNSMGVLEFSRGNYEATAVHLRQALEIREMILGPTHEDVGSSWHNLGQVYYEMGSHDQGREAYERSLAIRVPALGEIHPAVASTRHNYGGYLARSEGAYEAALEQLQGALRTYREIGGEGHPAITGVTTDLAFVQSRLGHWKDGERLLAERYRFLEGRDEPLDEIREALVDLYERWGAPERAAPYRTPPS